jgi:hypothetical protein
MYTLSGLSRHLSQSRECRSAHNESLCAEDDLGAALQPTASPPATHQQESDDTQAEHLAAQNLARIAENWNGVLDAERGPESPGASGDDFDRHPPNKETARVHVTPFPNPDAGFKFGRGETHFENWKRKEAEGSNSIFDDYDIWELAHWLVTSGLSSGARDRFFKLQVVSSNLRSICNSIEFETL